MLPTLDVRLTAAQAAAAVGVSRQLVNYWRRTGRITPDDRGTYAYADILTAEYVTRTSPQSHRT